MLRAYNTVLLLELLAIGLVVGKPEKQPRFKKDKKLPKRITKINGMEFEDIYELS